MKRLAILLPLAAAACGGNERPAVKVETVERVVEVQKPCPADAPIEPEPIGPLPTDAIQLAATLGAKLLEFTGPGQYVDQAKLYFRMCPPEKVEE